MKIAVLRIRGGFKIRKEHKDTMKMLRLHKKNHLVLLDDTPVNKGMINKVRHWVTYGPIREEVLKELIKKRGRLSGNKRVEMTEKELDKFVKDFMAGKAKLSDKGIKPVFRLKPPKKGFEKLGIKFDYPRGALGPRGDAINELLLRMI